MNPKRLQEQNIQSLFFLLCPVILLAMPNFDPATLFQDILVPADAAIGSIIYRLRASDPTFDYPLTFTLDDKSTTIVIENLNCSRLNSICQANVVLNKKLEIDRFYDFTVKVTNQRHDSNSMNCSFRATNATTPIAEIFPGAPTLLRISENARRNTELGVIMAKGNPNRANGVLLELWGSSLFGLHQKLVTKRDAQGTLLLLGTLDYEKQNVHYLNVLANDPWTEGDKDTRNIASWSLLIAVIDEQDTPPVFTLAPPTTMLNPNLKPGDLILNVHAEDGDRGNPRDIRYGLLLSANGSIPYFDLSEKTGELRLARPLKEIMNLHLNQPIFLNVVAEEVRSNSQEPAAQSTTVQIALIPPSLKPGTITFGAKEYHALLDENVPAGTILTLPQSEVIAEPGEIIALSLTNDNGTFEISPSVIESQGEFEIKVRDPELLDYEKWHSVECYIVARELSFKNITITAKLIVLLNDVNDNVPKFTKDAYYASIEENAPFGTTVLRVEATDVDREPGSIIQYTRLNGAKSPAFNLDPITGLITVTNSEALDAEDSTMVHLTVEARDENGKGKITNASVIVSLIDRNDEVPIFDKSTYEFILNEDSSDFTTEAFIHAIDKDVSSPNNQVHYELINENRVYVNENTGRLSIRKKWDENNVVQIKARAWDGGIPILSSECEIKIYPSEGQSRTLSFIINGANPNRQEVMKTLQALTGAHVRIKDVKPYTDYDNDPNQINISEDDVSERSVVTANLSYDKNTVVDIQKIKNLLETRKYQTKQNQTKQTGGGNLMWLLILLIILALLTALILIMCCICKGCPLYVPPKRKKIVSTDMQKLVKGAGYGSENKSVQVAEWFGRKEAWSPERVMIDNEAESLQRHEYERGSDRVEGRRNIPHHSTQHQLLREPSREQLYIREGNADILRLITRGGDTQRPVTLVGDQSYLNDTGKEILMRRFINQQTEQSQTQNTAQANITRIQSDHELIEASLRQQNVLLRQILLDRERDLRLETQSLPAGTQTDQNVATQTEPEFLLPPRRKVRSDNDASEDSDDEGLKNRGMRKTYRKISHSRRKIKTPIQEESDTEQPEKKETVNAVNKPNPSMHIKQTKTSKLRQMRNLAEQKEKPSSSGIYKEVLREISDSLDPSVSSDEGDIKREKYVKKRDYFSDDSLEDYIPRLKVRDANKQRYYSESDLRNVSSRSRIKKSSSQRSIKVKNQQTENQPQQKGGSRYMEWYNKNPGTKSDLKTAKRAKPVSKIPTSIKRNAEKEQVKAVMPNKSSSTSKKDDEIKTDASPKHPLLQHSEHRFEIKYPKISRRVEEDADSGIALTKPAAAYKKSVFTIAYDDMHTNKLVTDARNSPV